MPAKKQVPRQAILAASLSLLREGGMEAVNLQALTRRLKCSTQPVYLSFSGMDELREETAKAAQAYFLQFMQEDGEEAPCLYGLRYIRFALQESRLFQYLFMRPRAYEEMKSVLLPIIERSMDGLMATYGISRREAHRFHDQLWVYAHGIAAMVATAYCDWDMETVAQMLRDARTYLGVQYGGGRP